MKRSLPSRRESWRSGSRPLATINALKPETAMYRRVKQLIGAKLSLRNYNAQVGEALAWVKAINRMTGLGMPVRQQVN